MSILWPKDVSWDISKKRATPSCESASVASALPTREPGPGLKSMTDLKSLRQVIDRLLSPTGWNDLLADL